MGETDKDGEVRRGTMARWWEGDVNCSFPECWHGSVAAR